MLNESAFYFPLKNGRYEVNPGLHPFGTDFGNGEQDKLVFQFDRDFARYRQSKIEARQERLSKYYLTSGLSPESIRGVVKFILHRLVEEWPLLFSLANDGKRLVLRAELTKEELIFNENYDLVSQLSDLDTPYADAFDALTMQIQEDLAIWCLDKEQEKEWLGACHVFSPNHWNPEEKIGKTFAEAHIPVAHIERINKVSMAIVDAIVNKGPYVRFAWGVATDNRLNHHPVPPQSLTDDTWTGRRFTLENPELFLRVERQTLWPFPKEGASLFAIRTYFVKAQTFLGKPEFLDPLISAIETMTPEARKYKGLTETASDIVQWLKSAEAPCLAQSFS